MRACLVCHGRGIVSRPGESNCEPRIVPCPTCNGYGEAKRLEGSADSDLWDALNREERTELVSMFK